MWARGGDWPNFIPTEWAFDKFVLWGRGGGSLIIVKPGDGQFDLILGTKRILQGAWREYRFCDLNMPTHLAPS